MAKKFKDYYDKEWAELFAGKIKSVDSSFNDQKFINATVDTVDGREFIDRQDAIVEVFVDNLGSDYKKNIKLFESILGPKLAKPEGMFTEGYWLWPVGRYVEKYGSDFEKISMDFIYELTQRFTGEFAIRPILEKSPEKTLATILEWSNDPSVHVRRLSSEGIRMRLPWAPKSNVFYDYFDKSIKVLDNLINDEYKFVQKSVGNTMNDLSKTDPDLVIKTTDRWLSQSDSKETAWIVKHSLRTINKKK